MLNFTAHIQGGHYAVESIPAGGSISVDLLAASYNGVSVKPVRVFVSNYANDGQISVTVAGIIASIVPSYSNKNIEIQGLLSLTLSNTGTVAVNVMFADEKMLGIAADVYASLTVTSLESSYDIVNNFELFSLTDIENEGRAEGVTYSLISGTKLSGEAKFGNRAIYYSDTSGNDTSGLIIEKSAYFDMSKDWTLAFWAYSLSWTANTVLCRIGCENASLNNSITIYAAVANNMRVNYFGSVTADQSTTFNGWKHIALSKIGSTLYVFFTGARQFTLTVPTSGTMNKIGIGYAGLNNALYKNWGGNIDALFYLNNTGLWNNTYTVPTTAPI